MIQGSCCCGEIAFEVTRKPKVLVVCHCSRCRKLGTSAFVIVESDSFQLTKGRDRVVELTPKAPHKYPRSFCQTCGTGLGEILSDGKEFPVAANCFDDDIGLDVYLHEYVESKPAWFVIGDQAKQFERDPS